MVLKKMTMPEISEEETAKTLAEMREVINKNNESQHMETDDSEVSPVDNLTSDIEEQQTDISNNVNAPPDTEENAVVGSKTVDASPTTDDSEDSTGNDTTPDTEDYTVGGSQVDNNSPEIVDKQMLSSKTIRTPSETDNSENSNIDNTIHNTVDKSSLVTENVIAPPDTEDFAVGVSRNVPKAPPSIKDQRSIIEQSEEMNDLFIKYADLIQQKYESLDKKSNMDNKSNISKCKIVQSSKDTIVTPMKEFDEDPCKNLREFANVPYKYGMSTIFYKDMSNCDVFISPLKHLILRTDRYTLVQAAKTMLPDNRQ